MITKNQLEELFKDPDMGAEREKVWEGLGSFQELVLSSYSYESAAKFLDGKASLARNREAQSHRNKEIFKEASKVTPPNTSSHDDIETILFSMFGVAGATALVVYENPRTFHCDKDFLVNALQSGIERENEDNEMRVSLSNNGGVVLATVSQYLESSWVDLIDVSFTSKEGNTIVHLGRPKESGTMLNAVGFGKKALNTVQRLFKWNKKDASESTADKILGTLQGLPKEYSGHLNGLAVKRLIWKILEDATVGLEQAYFDRLGEEEKRKERVRLEKERKEALLRCEYCNNTYPKNINLGDKCPNCGYPIPPSSVETVQAH